MNFLSFTNYKNEFVDKSFFLIQKVCDKHLILYKPV